MNDKNARMMTIDFRASILTTVLFAALTLSLSSQGADIVKANNASDLNLTASWTGSILPGTSDRALFTSANTANRTTSLGADTAWGGIVLPGNTKTWNINGAFSLTLDPGGIDLSSASADFTLASPLQVALGAPQTWAVADGRKVTVTASVSGGDGITLIKDGQGTLLLNAATTYSGGTVLNGGTLSIGSSDAFGKSSLTISNGALKASSAGYSVTNPILLAGLATVSNTVLLTLNGEIRGPGALLRPAGLANTLVLGGNSTFSGGTTNGSTIQLNSANALGTGPIVLLDGGTLKPGPSVFGTGNTGGVTNTIILLGAGVVTSVVNTNIVMSGPIIGPGSLSKTVNGDLTLSGKNTYSGGTIFSGGRIRLGHINGLGTGPLTFNGSGIFVINSAIGNGDGNGITNNVVLASDATVNVQTYSALFSGVISGPGQFYRNNGPKGTLTLTGNNTFSGGLTNATGALVLGHVNALGTGTLDINEGSLSTTLDLSSGSGITNRIVINNTNGFGSVTVVASSNVRLSGVIEGSSGITKTGSQTLYLSGANTYSGDTVVSNGTLALSAGGSVTQSALIHIAAGANLDASAWASGYTFTNGQTLTGNGTVTGSVIIASGARISGGTTNTVGTLTFQNDLTLNDGAFIDWNVDSATGSTDVIRVNGTLSLPEHATVRISGASTLPKLRVLFKSSKTEGAAHVRNWTVLNGPQSMLAVLQDNQIVLLYTGLVVTFQ